MKKFYLVILLGILLLITSCESKNLKYKKFSRSNAKTIQRVASKFVYKIKPSESMKPGVSRVTKSSDFAQKTAAPKKNLPIEKSVTDDDLKTAEYKGDYKGYFKVGNPYQIFGVSYVPQNYEDYEEIGTASWYGDDFHGKLTANGEIYNMEEMTAAHPTLPLPSLVRVTNLKNNKSVIVRVNDRGPFAKSRIIDVSEKAADALGFKGQGTTQVKIELLRDETDELLEKLKLKK